PRTAIFVQGMHAGENMNAVMKDLVPVGAHMALKRPNMISFTKKNVVLLFEDASPLEFWSPKNETNMSMVGWSTRRRPHGMTFVHMFDYRVLE
ncbi:hypothetical protein L226DRAFT_443861, partial [Lentinus tigrinus ALCF2SS1-7]